MKRKLFYTPSGLIISAAMLIFAVTSCTKKTSELKQTSNPEEFATASAGNKPATYSVVPLIMTIVDAGNRITSDNGNPYINGVDNVKVVFDQYGNFMYGAASNNPKVPQPRFLKYDFSDPVTGYAARPDIEQGKSISSGQTTTSPNSTPSQNLAIGVTRCIGMTAGFTTLANGVLNFHRNPYDDTDAGINPTAYVYVTRIDNDRWEITAVPPPPPEACSSVSNVASLRISGILQGKYNMPFKFLLQRKLP